MGKKFLQTVSLSGIVLLGINMSSYGAQTAQKKEAVTHGSQRMVSITVQSPVDPGQLHTTTTGNWHKVPPGVFALKPTTPGTYVANVPMTKSGYSFYFSKLYNQHGREVTCDNCWALSATSSNQLQIKVTDTNRINKFFKKEIYTCEVISNGIPCPKI